MDPYALQQTPTCEFLFQSYNVALWSLNLACRPWSSTSFLETVNATCCSLSRRRLHFMSIVSRSSATLRVLESQLPQPPLQRVSTRLPHASHLPETCRQPTIHMRVSASPSGHPKLPTVTVRPKKRQLHVDRNELEASRRRYLVSSAKELGSNLPGSGHPSTTCHTTKTSDP